MPGLAMTDSNRTHRMTIILEIATPTGFITVDSAPAEFLIDAHRAPWTTEWSEPIATLDFIELGSLRLGRIQAIQMIGADELRRIEDDAASEWLANMATAA